MSNTTPVQVDYTSRDYESIRQDLVARIRRRLPQWTGTDPADFGVALVEAFAYLGDLLSYYVDRAANESALSTATRRESVVALATDLGYNPLGYRSSQVVLSISNSSEVAVEIPQGTVISANLESEDSTINIPFETDFAITIEPSDVSDVTATQGITARGEAGYGEYLGTSDGTTDQEFEIPATQVVGETIAVYLFDGVNYVPWTRVNDFTQYGPTDRVFKIIDPGTGTIIVRFGDGVSGLVPTLSHLVYASYAVTQGALGNVPAGAVTSLDSIPDLSSSEVAVIAGNITSTNDLPAFGGSDPESTESIRRLAPLSYRASNRAVTLEDYQSIALRIDGCGKASAVVYDPSSVVVAVAPYRTTASAEERPGFAFDGVDWIQTDELANLKSAVLERLQSVRLAGVAVSVVAPTYIPVFIEIDVVASPAVRQSDAALLIRETLLRRFDYTQVPFGAQIFESDLVSLISALGSVADDVSVVRLNIASPDDAGRGTVEAGSDELLVVLSENVTINVSGGIEESL
jgi:uncharacterized phage protein gp47/JayE